MACKFFEMIEKRWAASARVCVGLDPDIKKIPKKILGSKSTSSPLFMTNQQVVDMTKDLALCYKPNRAFYKGPEGLMALRNTVAHIRNVAEGVPIILDAKYGDIGNTNVGYSEEAFDWLKCDAVTVHNYMGLEAMKPFLEQKDKGIFVLCRTSNPGAGEFQDLPILYKRFEGASMTTMPLYEMVAEHVKQLWNYNGNCALVVGATFSDQLLNVRSVVGEDMWLLLPGFGSQGGDVFSAIRAGASKKGRVLGNSSSGIMFSSDPKAALQKLTDEINAALPKVPA